MRSRLAILASGLAVLAMTLTACSPIQPWVKPYEREHLADPIMAFDRDGSANAFIDHVYDVREAARGANGAVGGGCGCN